MGQVVAFKTFSSYLVNKMHLSDELRFSLIPWQLQADRENGVVHLFMLDLGKGHKALLAWLATN